MLVVQFDLTTTTPPFSVTNEFYSADNVRTIMSQEVFDVILYREVQGNAQKNILRYNRTIATTEFLEQRRLVFALSLV